jgi:uncharacterized coiled-coil DUF342 family protein
MGNMQHQSRTGATPEKTAAETREMYRQKYEAQIREYNSRIEEIRAHADRLGAQARLDMQPRVDAVHKRYESVRSRLQDLATAADDTWDEVKQNAEKAWIDFKSAVEGAYDALKSQRRGEDKAN